MIRAKRHFSFAVEILVISIFALTTFACRGPNQSRPTTGTLEEIPVQMPIPVNPGTSTAQPTQGTESSGGGSFVESMFRQTAKLALQDLKYLGARSRDNQKHNEALSPLIEDERAVRIVISEKQLLHPEKGNVDALNFPQKKEIHLYGPAWRKRFESDRPVKNLVLHEYFGLTKFDDQSFQITNLYFPSNGMAPDFDSTHATCAVTGMSITKGQTQVTWSSTKSTFQVVPLKQKKHGVHPDIKTAEFLLPYPGANYVQDVANLPRDFQPLYLVKVTLWLRPGEVGPRPRVYADNPRPAVLKYTVVMYRRLGNGKGELIGMGEGIQNYNGFLAAEILNLDLQTIIEQQGFTRADQVGAEPWSLIRDGIMAKHGENYLPHFLKLTESLPQILPTETSVHCEVGSLKDFARDKDGTRLQVLPRHWGQF